MKITKEQLKKIIKEELEETMKETTVTGERTPFHPPSDQSPVQGGGDNQALPGGPLETQLAHALASWGYEKVKALLDSMAEQGAAAKAKQGTLWNDDGTPRFK
tara:strand:+ start:292 stop:600 length:309 start_codon:yes stop_codon:yes gene_type:complete